MRNFNTIVSTPRDWFQRLGMIPRDRRISFITAAFAQITLSAVMLCVSVRLTAFVLYGMTLFSNMYVLPQKVFVFC
jgi:hypothetical protein